MLERLCYLIELRNVHARTRHNAYVRNHRLFGKVRSQCGIGYTSGFNVFDFMTLAQQRKVEANSKIYSEANTKLHEAAGLYNKEIMELCKALGLRTFKMSCCPIIQGLHLATNKQTRKYEGRDIRKFAAMYKAEQILLK